MPKLLRLLLFVVGLILVTDCVILIGSNRINFGTVMPFLIGIIFLVHALFWPRIKIILTHSHGLKILWKGLWAVFSIWLISFVVFAVSLNNNIKKVDEAYAPVDAIIVLGGGIKNGKPTPTLANRLDTAAPLIKEQPDAVVITSGGIGIGETVSEAQAMAEYLYDQHDIALSHISLEAESTSTDENFLYSQMVLIQNGVALNDPIAIVTSDFHIPRSKAIAEHQGYKNIIPLASPTPLSIRYNAWFREYFAYISGWLLGEY